MDALAVLLPRRCGVCRLPGASLCPRCRRDLVRLVPPVCERCGAPGPWPLRRCVECAGRRLAFASVRAALVYDRRARSLVVSWKERGRRDLTATAAELVAEAFPAAPAPIVTFVPPDTDRRLVRGMHTPRALALALARGWGVEAAALLRRRSAARPQRGLTLAERRANLRRAFGARGEVPPHVCLVDDVYTTGSTAHACASALRRGGARRVDVVTLARAIRSG